MQSCFQILEMSVTLCLNSLCSKDLHVVKREDPESVSYVWDIQDKIIPGEIDDNARVDSIHIWLNDSCAGNRG